MHEPVGPEIAAIFSFNIPIVSEKHEYQHYQISTLPFITFQNQSSQFRIKIPGLPHVSEILISKARPNKTRKMYQVQQDSIKYYPTNKAATITLGELDSLSTNQTECISAILDKDTTAVSSRCNIEESDTEFEIHRINPSRYIYFSKEQTQAQIECPILTITENKSITDYKQNTMMFNPLTSVCLYCRTE